jgi:hypothetical protein
LICLAFATWCFADTWVEYAEGNVAYFARYDPFRAVAVPVIALQGVLTLAMFAGWEFCLRQRLNRVVALHFLFLALCLAPLGIVSVALLRAAPLELTAWVRAPWFWPAALLAGAAPLVWACLRPLRASRLMRSALLYSWPILILVLVQAARSTLLYPHSAYADGALGAPLLSARHAPRVVWIVFDELSQAIAFGNRAAGMALPNLDALREESFYASAAESPTGRTETSLPSLILGEKVLRASPDAPGDLRVSLSSHPEPVPWSSLPNVFDAARGLGFNTALVGWFHPYGRVLGHSLTKCYWTAGWLPPGVEEPSESRALPEGMWDRVRLQFVAMPLIGHLPGVDPETFQRQAHLRRFAFLSDRAREIVADPEIGMALIHLPVPHPPAIYDRARSKFDSGNRGSYLDNVVLVDRELGTLRRAMEEAGLWDRTAVLVSADHGWRTALWRATTVWTAEDEAASHQDTMGVPFLLKLPGQTSGSVYEKRFNTVVTRALITAILSGQVTDAAAVVRSLEGTAGH